MVQGDIAKFRRAAWAHYKKQGRHDLPWRKTRDPYKILVSEVMLQQTQVERVIPFYKKFTKQFPTARRLAAAPLSAVLKAWQGLGYNRRAKLLHAAAKSIMKDGMPRTVVEIENLPGVGRYTARAIAAFAWGQDVILIETNIRTAAMHHFFPKRRKVHDAEIEKMLLRALPKGKALEWYSALMDYGAHLKRSGVRMNVKSSAYAKQTTFAGSVREARGAILRELTKGSQTGARLTGLLGAKRRAQCTKALAALVAEGLIEKKRNRFALVD